jgi:hypothetical protein
MCLIWLFILIKHLYLSDMWVGVVQEHIHEGQVFKKIGPRVQKMIATLGSIVKIIGGDLCDHLVSIRTFTLIYV